MDYSSFEHNEDEKQIASPAPKSLRVLRLIVKGLSIALIMLLIHFVTRHSLPLLKPVRESIVQRLCDVLRFIVVTTVVSFGILNSQWKAIERADPWTEEDDRHRRAPLLNNSIINEMEHKNSKEGITSDFPENSKIVGNTDVGRIEYQADGMASSPGMERLAAVPVQEVHTKVHVNTATASEILESTVTPGENTHTVYEVDLEFPNRNAAEAATDEIATDSRAGLFSGESYSRGLAIPPISEGLTAVANTNFKSTCVSKERPILHRRVASPHSWNREKSRRRSSSVDVPAQRQSSRVSNSGDADGSTVKMDVQPKAISNLVMSSGNSRSNLNVDLLNENMKPARSSRRHASLSCDFGDSSLNLDQLNEYENFSRADLDPSVTMDVQPKAISNLVMGSGNSRRNLNVDRLNENMKPARSSRRHASFSCDFGDGALNLDQLNENEKSARASRRYASVSYDFGEDYSPEWLIEHAPPPPLTDPSDSETDASSPIDRAMCAPSANATPLSLVSHRRSSPVDISPSANPSDSHPPQAALVEELPPSVSPSPGELNRKADAFIARFYEQMRLQRAESLERRRSKIRSARKGYNY